MYVAEEGKSYTEYFGHAMCGVIAWGTINCQTLLTFDDGISPSGSQHTFLLVCRLFLRLTGWRGEHVLRSGESCICIMSRRMEGRGQSCFVIYRFFWLSTVVDQGRG